MSQKKRQFTREFKLQVVREVEAGKSIAQAAGEHQLHPTLIGKWRSQNSQYGFAPSQATAIPIKMRLASLNWSV